jgi:hypothetical protein
MMTQAETVGRWQERLSRFDKWHATVAQFCADEGISQPSFYHWRRKLRGPAMQPTPIVNVAAARFVPVALHAPPDTPDGVPRAVLHSPACHRHDRMSPWGHRLHLEQRSCVPASVFLWTHKQPGSTSSKQPYSEILKEQRRDASRQLPHRQKMMKQARRGCPG